MPNLQAEDPDPLLSFSIEPGAAPAVEASPQPIAPAVDQPSVSPPSTPPELLLSRIEQLERALDESRSQVASLKAQVTTLVGAVGDIGKMVNQTPLGPRTPSGPRASRSASAIIGVLIGVSAAIFGWMLLSSDAEVPIVASAPARTLIAEAAPVTLAPIAYEGPASPKPEVPKPVAPKPEAPKPAPLAAPRREAPRAAAAPEPEATKYVGTLSIDSEPGGEVFLNRQSAGHTPLQLTNLRAGSHLIWIERAGYRRWTGVVQVPSDRVSRLSAELEPIAPR